MKVIHNPHGHCLPLNVWSYERKYIHATHLGSKNKINLQASERARATRSDEQTRATRSDE